MTEQQSRDAKERQHTQEAWERLEAKLRTVEPSPLWAQWEERKGENSRAAELTELDPGVEHGTLDSESGLGETARANGRQESPPRKPVRRSWARHHAWKLGTACAAVLLFTIIAVPTTNEALAALLNRFKMNEVVVVQSNDLEQLMNLFNDNKDRSLLNTFGSFTRETHGESKHDVSDQQVEAKFGIRVPHPLKEQLTYSVSAIMPATDLTLTLNVDEINGVMKKLGADRLLPDSVDGKEIRMNTGETLHLYYSAENDGRRKSASVSYTDLPTIEIDPSIDAKEALEAVVRLPGMPEGIRSAIVQSARIEQGVAPLPIITSGVPVQSEVNGTTVYTEQREDRDGTLYGQAIWLLNGKYATLNYYSFDNEAEIQKLLSEIVGHE
ncbi:hypothetical protein [Paenibacillus sp. NPDC058071]|uniref:hypothetical protein n=1 Tax=Paenibacillus sp. NPDC058071 TaxID=3346326 RepID=UPI0036DE9C76